MDHLMGHLKKVKITWSHYITMCLSWICVEACFLRQDDGIFTWCPMCVKGVFEYYDNLIPVFWHHRFIYISSDRWEMRWLKVKYMSHFLDYTLILCHVPILNSLLQKQTEGSAFTLEIILYFTWYCCMIIFYCSLIFFYCLSCGVPQPLQATQQLIAWTEDSILITEISCKYIVNLLFGTVLL